MRSKKIRVESNSIKKIDVRRELEVKSISCQKSNREETRKKSPTSLDMSKKVHRGKVRIGNRQSINRFHIFH